MDIFVAFGSCFDTFAQLEKLMFRRRDFINLAGYGFYDMMWYLLYHNLFDEVIVNFLLCVAGSCDCFTKLLPILAALLRIFFFLLTIFSHI